MEDTQQQQPTPTPDRDIISLFVSEEPTTPKQRSVSVPVAGMPPTPTPVPVAQIVPPSTPAAPSPVPAPEEQVEEEVVSPFVQKLRDIEDNAKAEIAGWDPIYLGQAAEANAAGSGTGTKRKGGCLQSLVRPFADLLQLRNSTAIQAMKTVMQTPTTKKMWCSRMIPICKTDRSCRSIILASSSRKE